MADYLLVVRNKVNEKAHASNINKVFMKGDVIDILPLGMSPGTVAAKIPFFSYAEVRNVNLKDIVYLKEVLRSSILDVDGRKTRMKRKRRYTLPDSTTDTLSKDWKKPTVINLGSVSLSEKT